MPVPYNHRNGWQMSQPEYYRAFQDSYQSPYNFQAYLSADEQPHPFLPVPSQGM